MEQVRSPKAGPSKERKRPGYGGKEGRTREESDGKGKERKLHFFSPSHHSFRPLSLTINSNILQKVIASDWGQCRGGEGRWKLYTGYRP